jgi:hypothetical protein
LIEFLLKVSFCNYLVFKDNFLLSFILYPLVFNVVFDHRGQIATGKRGEMGGGKEGDGIEPLVKCFLFTKSLVKQNCSRWLAFFVIISFLKGSFLSKKVPFCLYFHCYGV